MDGLEGGILEHHHHAGEIPMDQPLVVFYVFLGDDPLVGELDGRT